MTDILGDLEGLDSQVTALESSLVRTGDVAAAFEAELATMRTTMLYTGREVNSLSRSFGSSLKRAFDGLVFDGDRLSDVLRSLGRSMADAAFATAIKPVQNALGGLLADGVNKVVSGILPFANGASFSQGRVQPFASGGVVSGPTFFPMRGGMGLMGEAGPEAIMPLARGADGKLGVRTQGGGRPVQVTMNITTPDVEGFRRSQSQIAAQMGRALGRGARNR